MIITDFVNCYDFAGNLMNLFSCPKWSFKTCPRQISMFLHGPCHRG